MIEIESTPPTVAQKLVENMEKISKALNEMEKAGIPKTIILSIIAQKTKLPLRDIKLVLNALEETAQEMNAPAR